MREALQERPVKGTTSSVNIVNTENKTLEMVKLKGFSSFHNFHYEESGIRIWKAFSVGKGQLIPYSSLFLKHQGPTNLSVVEDQSFFPAFTGRIFKTQPNKKSELLAESESEVRIYECSEPACCQEFDSMEDLDVHKELGIHDVPSTNESIYDQFEDSGPDSLGPLVYTRTQPSQFCQIPLHVLTTESGLVQLYPWAGLSTNLPLKLGFRKL